MITLGNIRADSVDMGGKKYVAENAVSPGWVVTTSTNLSLHYTNKHGEATSISLQTKQGDHLENVEHTSLLKLMMCKHLLAKTESCRYSPLHIK